MKNNLDNIFIMDYVVSLNHIYIIFIIPEWEQLMHALVLWHV